MVTQTLSPFVFVCVSGCVRDCQQVRCMNLADIILSSTLCVHPPAECLPACVCLCVRAICVYMQVSVCEPEGVCPRVCNIMMAHIREYICGFKSHCLHRMVQALFSYVMRRLQREWQRCVRPLITDLLYRTQCHLNNYFISRIKITSWIHLRWGDGVKIYSVLVSGKAEVWTWIWT